MNESDVHLRDLKLADISSIMDYWYRSPLAEIEAMGVDRSKMISEEEFRAYFVEKVESNIQKPESQMTHLIVEVNGHPIGYHSLSPFVENEEGTFHSHFWDKNFIGIGVGTISYKKSCDIYFERFNLKKIIFKTPVKNIAAIRIKEKLNIKKVGEGVLEGSVYIVNTLVNIYQLDRCS